MDPSQPQQPGPPPAPGTPPPGQPGYPASGGAEPWKQQYTPPPAAPQQPAQQAAGYSYGGWREELATREHWDQTWQQAKARDIAWRREREQRQLEQARRNLEQNTTSTDIRS